MSEQLSKVAVAETQYPQPKLTDTLHTLDDRSKTVLQGSDVPKLRSFESRTYQLIAEILRGENTSDVWIKEPPSLEIPIAIAHRDFAKNQPDFTRSFVTGRQTARTQFESLAASFQRSGLTANADTCLSFIPVLLLNVDNIPQLAQDIGIEETTMREALDEIPYLKANDNYILSSSEAGHDYPSYVTGRLAEFGLSLEEFVAKQQVHELLQLLTNPLTEKRFGKYDTWYNEGAGDLLARFSERAAFGLRQTQAVSTLEELLESCALIGTDTNTDNADVFHAKAWLLVSAIVKAYAPESPEKGFFIFSNKLFGESADPREDLNKATVRIIDADNLSRQVDENIKAILATTTTEQ